jgi:hypothetical protein
MKPIFVHSHTCLLFPFFEAWQPDFSPPGAPVFSMKYNEVAIGVV